MDIRGKYLSHSFLMMYSIIVSVMLWVSLFMLVISNQPSQPTPDPSLYEQLQKYTDDHTIITSIIKWSTALKVDPLLVATIIKYESGFNRYAINENTNESIDRGLMQLNNQVYGDGLNFWDADLNIQLGTNNIKWCLDQSSGNLIKALAMYNAGIWRVKNNRVPEMTLDYSWKIISELQKVKSSYNE